MRKLDKLYRLAGEATPGPWGTRRLEGDPGQWFCFITPDIADLNPTQPAATAAHIAANDPDTVRALVRVARAAERLAALVDPGLACPEVATAHAETVAFLAKLGADDDTT